MNDYEKRDIKTNNIITKPGIPNFPFNNFPKGNKFSYRVILNDVLNYKKSEYQRSKHDYIVFEAQFQSKYDNIGVSKGLLVNMHFPRKTFEIAWQNCINRPSELPQVGKIDVEVSFYRENVKKLVFKEIKAIDSSAEITQR